MTRSASIVVSLLFWFVTALSVNLRQGQEQHQPIVVDGDTDLLKLTHRIWNPLAKGTREDPIVIKGYKVVGPPVGTPCFSFANTSKHIILQAPSCTLATTGISLINVSSIEIVSLSFSQIVGIGGASSSLDGGPGIGAYIEDCGNVSLSGSGSMSFIYGGAGFVTGFGTKAGCGGSAYGILATNVSNISVTGLSFSSIYGGAGAAGLVSVGIGTPGGAGGEGGNASAISIDGVETVSISKTSLSTIYGGAGGAGALGNAGPIGGNGGESANGGNLHGIFINNANDWVNVSSTTFGLLFGGAGSAGGAGDIYSGNGSSGADGGHVAGIYLVDSSASLSVTNCKMNLLYGGAGAAGSAGAAGLALSGYSGGTGGFGGRGGFSVGVLVEATASGRVVVADNLLEDLKGGAGGAGATGAIGDRGGQGGHGGIGGWAAGVCAIGGGEGTMVVKGSTMTTLRGAAGAVGGLSALGYDGSLLPEEMEGTVVLE